MQQNYTRKEDKEFLSKLKSINKKDGIYPEDLPGYGNYLANNIGRMFKKVIKENPSGEIYINKEDDK